MSRLPDLERALLDAATRLDADVAEDRRHIRRWRRAPLLAAVGSLFVAGAAIAVTGLLDSGDPVPAGRGPGVMPVPATTGFTLASVRAADPDGGPAWGVGTYAASPRAAASRTPVTCVVVGRVQDGRLGVVGRDGVFGDDGRFHPLSPAAQSSGACAGRAKDGAFMLISSGPPIPASGYTGAPGTAIGGCRERVDLDGPTVSPQTRRKLRGVPHCRVSGLRRVVAGFAGPRAVSATLAGPGYRKTLKLESNENGAYLFVMRSASTAPPRLSITDRDGNVCEPFGDSTCP